VATKFRISNLIRALPGQLLRIWLLILNRLAYHVGNVNVRDVLKLLRRDGWSLVTTVGSHRQLKHTTKPGRVTVSGHPSDDIHPKTLKSILTQAGLKK
jgi:predicted RNA binding protein YcfA (HicA-like mRNA interferase family)